MQVTMLYGLKVFAYGGNAALMLTDKDTGEVYEIRLLDGVHDLSSYHPLMAAFNVEVVSSIVNNVAVGERRLVDQRGIDYADTAAVPTYTPSEAVRFERLVRDISLRVAEEAAAKAEKRQRQALALSAQIPSVPDGETLVDLQPGIDPVDPVLTRPIDVKDAKPAVLHDEPVKEVENDKPEKPNAK